MVIGALSDEYAAWEQDYDAAKDILVKVGTETKENFVTLKAAEMDTAAPVGFMLQMPSVRPLSMG